MATFSSGGLSKHRKRLMFDRRYGWVYDQWKDPSEEALTAGRGMFCIVPVARALLTIMLRSIDFASNSVIKFIERPKQGFSMQAFATDLCSEFQKLKASIPKTRLNLTFKRSQSILSSGRFELDQQKGDDSENI